jgi:hypothetical protein
MAFEVSDIFAALATGDPYAGRSMRLRENALGLQERLGMGALGMDDRRLKIAEMMAPTELDTMQAQLEQMGQNLHEQIRTRPFRLAEAEKWAKVSTGLGDLIERNLAAQARETDKRTSKLADAASEFMDSMKQGGQSLWDMLSGGGAQQAAARSGMATLGAPVAAGAYAGQTDTLGGLPGAFAAVSEEAAVRAAAKTQTNKKLQQARIAEITSLAQRLRPQSVVEALGRLGYEKAPVLEELDIPSLEKILRMLSPGWGVGPTMGRERPASGFMPAFGGP